MAKTSRIEALLTHFTTPRHSIEERFAVGKALRELYPREQHAILPADRAGLNPVAILQTQAATRVQRLVPLRHARMQASEFAFLRGSAAIMAHDLSLTQHTGLLVQTCGDMHVSNIGLYASAERNLVLAINDFDETHIGAWEWDLKRLAASAVVAAAHIGADSERQREAARLLTQSYRLRMREYGKKGFLNVWYDRLDQHSVLEAFSPEVHDRVHAVMAKARRRDNLQVLGKMTDLIDNQHRIRELHPFVIRETHTDDGRPVMEVLGVLLDAYISSLPEERQMLLSRYRLVDVVRKVVGVGSVGTRCWVILLTGADDDDPLFLQVKEAQPSVLAPYFPSNLDQGNQGKRVVRGQRLIQGSPDIFLGWCEVEGRHFYVRQLRDMKGSLEIEPGAVRPRHFVDYCRLCGWALALAHAKSGDAAQIAGYMGKSGVIDQAIADFAVAYRDRNAQDYLLMKQAIARGELAMADITSD
ncbi:DUF2252 domain-containing protein [Aeromonas cavernicola]|uniref:DUF2252 domain-containing protein n=1 Tax=Aeromonas cavernicola TaxID=1006623 RepID=A0A2H9U6L3_9GAMM|nr:DUF2252 domain-containing protein [Aeromonas cavernicola]PJG59619.1 DUF2252 domain-containing protein [Aeromonas cavernicola]